MHDINKIYSMLDAKNPEEIIEKGMCEARQIEDLSLLIMPLVREFVWESCARVLVEKSDEELEPYIPNLLEWLNDLNWPGAWIILERLQLFAPEKLEPHVVNLFHKLNASDDFSDLSWASNILKLLDSNHETWEKTIRDGQSGDGSVIESKTP